MKGHTEVNRRHNLPRAWCVKASRVSDTMHSFIGFRYLTAPQIRQLTIPMSTSKQNNFVGELTFWNSLMNTFCEMKGHDQVVRGHNFPRAWCVNAPGLSDTMHLFTGFKKLTAPQIRQLTVFMSTSKQHDFVGELTLWNSLSGFESGNHVHKTKS